MSNLESFTLTPRLRIVNYTYGSQQMGRFQQFWQSASGGKWVDVPRVDENGLALPALSDVFAPALKQAEDGK